MKKYRLKGWVKVGLVSMFLLAIAYADYKVTDNAINQCVAAGNTYSYCFDGLR